MGQFIHDLLLIDLIIQLAQRFFGLVVLAVVIIVIVALLGGQCFGGVCIPDVIYLEDVLDGVLGAAGQPPEGTPECPKFPEAFPQLLPDTWSLRKVESINIDDDKDEMECLAVYEYNAGAGAFGGPLGGVIYDPQPDRDPRSMQTPIPYRPAAYVPYHLLPREDGKGFLSERAGDWSEMIQIYDADGDTFNELVFRGFSGYSFPTYLSIFEWQNEQDGYRLMTSPVTGETVGGSLWGEAGVKIKRDTRTDEEGNEVPTGPIQKVTVMTRPEQPFWYFRSQLCHAKIYRWHGAPAALVQDDYYLTFCFGRPDDVDTRRDEYRLWYPEEALLAWYEDGEVRDISIPAHPVGNTLEAVVTLRQGSRQRWLVTWKLSENTDEQVGHMTFWYLEQIGQPYDP
ncbi:MAG: hypothetical protein MAG451_00639 [Anaerolineales bacterium]|nr:hypothetical protein [Anaerolineales bacterium]